eukprot:366361-Chlamydomonas_euryale.AAC.1
MKHTTEKAACSTRSTNLVHPGCPTLKCCAASLAVQAMLCDTPGEITWPSKRCPTQAAPDPLPNAKRMRIQPRPHRPPSSWLP